MTGSPLNHIVFGEGWGQGKSCKWIRTPLTPACSADVSPCSFFPQTVTGRSLGQGCARGWQWGLPLAPPGVSDGHDEGRAPGGAGGGSIPLGPPRDRTVDYLESRPGPQDATCLQPAFALKEIIGSCNQKSRAFFGFRHGWILGGLVCASQSALLGLPAE